MEITLTLPDDLASKLLAEGRQPVRAVLEAVGLEAYREHRISAYQLRMLLGIPSRWELDAFLKEHEVYDYTIEDFDHDLATIRATRAKREAESRA